MINDWNHKDTAAEEVVTLTLPVSQARSLIAPGMSIFKGMEAPVKKVSYIKHIRSISGLVGEMWGFKDARDIAEGKTIITSANLAEVLALVCSEMGGTAQIISSRS